MDKSNEEDHFATFDQDCDIVIANNSLKFGWS